MWEPAKGLTVHITASGSHFLAVVWGLLRRAASTLDYSPYVIISFVARDTYMPNK
jgi:hypothetical protein